MFQPFQALHTNVENEIHNLLVATDNSTTLIDVQEQTETFTTDNIVLNSTQTREINQNALTDSKSTKRKMDNNGEFIQKKCRIKRGPNKPECDVYDQATESPKIPDETIKSVEDQTTTKRAVSTYNISFIYRCIHTGRRELVSYVYLYIGKNMFPLKNFKNYEHTQKEFLFKLWVTYKILVLLYSIR